MKFETLKTNCARFFYNHYNQNMFDCAALESLRRMKETGKLNPHREVLQDFKDKAYDAIMRTDIRNVKALSDSFPSIVPVWVRAGNYTPEYTDNGWELININTITD